MKFYKILIILVMVVVVVFAVLFIVVNMFQGPPPKMAARFKGGNPVSSDVRITDVFRSKRKSGRSILVLVSKHLIGVLRSNSMKKGVISLFVL